MGSLSLNVSFLWMILSSSSAQAAELRAFRLEKPEKSPPSIAFALPYTLGTHRGHALDAEGEVSVEWPNLKVVGGRFRVAVLDIDTGSKKMNCHLQEALGLDYSVSDFPKSHVCESTNQLPVTGKNALAYSWITFMNLSSENAPAPFEGKPTAIELKGQWSVHGVTKEGSFRADVSADPSDPQLLRVQAEVPFRLEDYGIQVKPFLFIKVKDEARVKFDLRFRRKS